MELVWDIGTAQWKAGSLLTNIGPMLAGVLMFVLAIAVSAYSAFLVALSKVALAILVAIGPLFIMGLLFEATKKFFESWMAQLCNFSLVLILVMAVNGFIIKGLQHFLPAAQAAGSNLEPLGPLAIIAVIGCFILAQVLSMASALGGGIALSTMGAGRWASDKAWRGGKWAVPKAGKTAAYPVKKLAPRAWAAVTRRGSVSQG